MIPILYESDEKDFVSSGIGYLVDATSCKVSEERNGIYELELEYPLKGALYSEIYEGRIILATHDESREGQPFVIYGRSEPIEEVVTFYAHHISYRLSNAVVMPFTSLTCSQAFTQIKAKMVPTSDFTFTTDKTTSAPYAVNTPQIVRDILGGEEHSILDVYGGGEYEFDKFNVMLHERRGEDTNVEIRRGKNLVNFEHTLDSSECYNAVVPYWYQEAQEGTPAVLVTLPERYVAHGTPSRIVAVPMDLTDQFETQPTVAQLRNLAKSQLEASKAWELHEGFSVDFVALWQTEEYKAFAPLQRVKLCDTVLVYYHDYGLDAVREKVVKTVYNTLLDRFDEITLNELPTTFSGILS